MGMEMGVYPGRAELNRTSAEADADRVRSTGGPALSRRGADLGTIIYWSSSCEFERSPPKRQRRRKASLRSAEARPRLQGCELTQPAFKTCQPAKCQVS